MIKSFSFSSYNSFEDEATIDFSVKTNMLGRTIVTGEYNKVVALYGGPSSGRSTILNALKLRSKEINFKADSGGDINAFHLDDMTVGQASKEYLNDSSMRKFMIRVLIAADLGITDVVIHKNGRIEFMHGSFSLGVERASSGTMRLYCILVGMHKAMATGGIALWDECGRLHPHLVKWLINLFYDSEAQLLISTNINFVWMTEHDCLKRNQIYLVEKNYMSSSVRRADKIDAHATSCDNLFINSL